MAEIKLFYDIIQVKMTKFGVKKVIVREQTKIFETKEEAFEFIDNNDITGYFLRVRERNVDNSKK